MITKTQTAGQHPFSGGTDWQEGKGMKLIDTDRMRRAATQIRNTGNGISDIAQGRARRVQGMVPEAVEGEMADALEEALEAMRREIASTADNLNSLARTLNAYADKFDEADAKISELIGGH